MEYQTGFLLLFFNGPACFFPAFTLLFSEDLDSEIFEINGIHTIILCLDVLSEFVPTFEEVSDQVKTKFIKDRDDALVKEYIENLRNFYDIEKYSL